MELTVTVPVVGCEETVYVNVLPLDLAKFSDPDTTPVVVLVDVTVAVPAAGALLLGLLNMAARPFKKLTHAVVPAEVVLVVPVVVVVVAAAVAAVDVWAALAVATGVTAVALVGTTAAVVAAVDVWPVAVFVEDELRLAQAAAIRVAGEPAGSAGVVSVDGAWVSVPTAAVALGWAVACVDVDTVETAWVMADVDGLARAAAGWELLTVGALLVTRADAFGFGVVTAAWMDGGPGWVPAAGVALCAAVGLAPVVLCWRRDLWSAVDFGVDDPDEGFDSSDV